MLLPKVFPVTSHTDHVGDGSIFVSIKGFQEDGSNYIDLAIKKGAKEIVLEHGESSAALARKYSEIKFSFVSNARRALAELSAEKNGHPASKLKIIGITGTKGKTTTAFLVEHILRFAGIKTALFGTIKNKILDVEEEAKRTTGTADELQVLLKKSHEAGVTHAVLEISSHALSLDRVHSLELDVACFTNLAPEHMDFYKDLDEYFDAKLKIFSLIKKEGCSVISTNDKWGKKALDVAKGSSSSVICSSERFALIENSLAGLKLRVDKKTLKIASLFGFFNANNVVSAFFIARHFGIDPEVISAALELFPGVPGRLQLHSLKNEAKAFVDFAHNASSMESVLKELRALSTHLIVVFGCGGDKDKTKRPVMGELAARYCDEIILTDDNPRNEDPYNIISEILSGIPDSKRSRTVVQRDRAKAIEKASALSGKGSIIAILGKGHESHYLFAGRKIFFDDFKQISLY